MLLWLLSMFVVVESTLIASRPVFDAKAQFSLDKNHLQSTQAEIQPGWLNHSLSEGVDYANSLNSSRCSSVVLTAS